MHRLLRPLGIAAGLFVAATLVDSCSADRAVGAPLTRIGVVANLMPSIRISEFHYDNPGADAGEQIEISGPAGTSVAGWRLVLYNGSATQRLPYATINLTGAFPASCGTRGVLVFNAVGLQNGSTSASGIDPDGIALVDALGNVVEFLSYEGSFTAITGPTGGPAAGMTSVDIGVREVGAAPEAATAPFWSLQRNGSDVWLAPAPSTFGTCNDEEGPPPPTVVSVVVTPATATIDEGATQQFTAKAYDGGTPPNELTGVAFTWSSTPASVASVNSSGLAAGISAGSATIRASAPNGVFGEATLTVNDVPDPVDGPVNIVEIHYDNDGNDAGEAIEVRGLAGQNLAGWKLVLYNQTGGAAYSTTPLSGVIPDQCSGEGTLAFSYPSNGIQNGPSDGVALVRPNNSVAEFLSYEGTLTASDGPAAGMTSVDIGRQESASGPIGRSLQKDALGWYGPNPQSFGLCNQALAPFVSIAGRSTLPVGFEDQFFATYNDGRGNTSSGSFTWGSDTPGIATVDADGVAHAAAVGTATLRATATDGATGTTSFDAIVATSGSAVYANHVEFGTPADADASDEVIISRAEFTSSFSRTRGIPNWVSFNLEATHFGPQDRCDCFTFDPLIGSAWPRYTTADYTGAGAFAGYGIDRGHLARSFDRTSGTLDNARTFYFSNIIPQASDNNQGPWSAMEIAVGDMARFQNKELFIIAGASGSKGTVKDEGLITIPAVTWKVVVVLPRDQGLASIDSWDDVEVIAVIMPNDPGIRNVNWETYRTTVDAVEALSGYDLLSLLPDEVEGIVESGLQDAFALVAQLVADGTLNKGNGNALTSKLEAAARSMFNGNGNAANGQIGAFLNQVDAFEQTGKLTAAQANALRAAVGVT